MDAQLKEKWIAALRSGDYEQGANYLKRGNNYCCLGVLCDVIGGPEVWEETALLSTCKCSLSGESTQSLSVETLRSIELDPDHEETLIEMNDDRDASFDEIADWIEENL